MNLSICSKINYFDSTFQDLINNDYHNFDANLQTENFKFYDYFVEYIEENSGTNLYQNIYNPHFNPPCYNLIERLKHDVNIWKKNLNC